MLTSMLRRGNVDGRNDKEWEKSIIREDGRSKEKRIWGLREVVLRISTHENHSTEMTLASTEVLRHHASSTIYNPHFKS